MSKSKLSNEVSDEKVVNSEIVNSENGVKDTNNLGFLKKCTALFGTYFKKHPIICVIGILFVLFLISSAFDGVSSSYDSLMPEWELDSNVSLDSDSFDSMSLNMDSFSGSADFGIASSSKSFSDNSQKSTESVSSQSSNSVSEDSKPIVETGASSNDLYNANNKIIYTGRLNVRTPNFLETNTLVRQKVSSYGGYIESYDISDSFATYTIRIPSKNFDAYMSDTDIHEGNNVTSNVSSEDVTLSYSETESLLASLKVREERLLSYLSEAANISEMLQIEEELQEVRGKIESKQNSLNLMDSYVNYSSITVEVRSISTSVVTPVSNISFVDKLLDTLKRSGDNFVDNCEGLLFSLILIVPMLFFNLMKLALILFVLWLIFLILKAVIKKISVKKVKKPSFKVTSDSDNETSFTNVVDESEKD